MGRLPQPKRLLLQGATGSIGGSVLAVVRAFPERFRIVGMAARTASDTLRTLAAEFKSPSLALSDESCAAGFAADCTIYTGANAAAAQAAEADYDLLVNALVGTAGLKPTAAALQRGLPVALANKEALVAAGPLILELARQNNTHVLPIDSEHSAIFQCLLGENLAAVRKLWLTTSGGPFWGRAFRELDNVTVGDALAHPTWKMGPKITVDCATLFNKGLEVIEAERLFGVPAAAIEVVAHRQSVVHSMVEFIDGSLKAQLSVPDMRLPILFALSYPDRLPSAAVQTGVEHLSSLTFEPVSRQAFPCLDLAFTALEKGGTCPAALSAADEIAVAAFLRKQIRFTDIAAVLKTVVLTWPHEDLTSLDVVFTADCNARLMAAECVSLLERKVHSYACY